jgi:oligopeptide transport system substrate-binding protein
MYKKATLLAFSLILIASLALSGCQQPTAEVQRVIETVVIEREGETIIVTQVVTVKETVEVAVPEVPAESGKKILKLSGGASDIPTIDPSHATQVIEIQVIGSTSIGLVRQNETTAEIEKGIATSYEVSDDGLEYTFKIMDNIPWVKWDANRGEVVKVQDCEGADRMVSAEDIRYGVLRTLNPITASEYAYVLTPYLKGADEYNSASIDDMEALETLASEVGVEVIDPHTIKFTFLEPGVYNLNLIGLWVAHAQPHWLIDGDDCTEVRGDRWTEQGFYQGYGPFTLKEWYHDYYMTLVKNPYWPGTLDVPVAKIDEVRLTFLDVSTSFADFEAGNLDSSSIPAGDMDRILADPKYDDMMQQVYTLGTEFYAFNTQLAPTDDARVRKALSLTIDRDAIVENVNKNGIAAPFFTNPGVAGAPKPENYPDLGMKYDPAAAKALLDEYLAEVGMTADQLKITLMFNTTEMNKKRAEAIQAMWKETLGVTVDLINQERRVYLAARVEGNENIYRSSWVQDYPDANNFLFEVFGPGAGYQDVVDWYEGEAYDQFVSLIRSAAQEADPDKRVELYAQAERILVNEQAVVAPIYWYSSPVLVQPYVKDFPSITGYDHWEKWDIQK